MSNYVTSSAISPGSWQILDVPTTPSGTWVNYSMSYTCSVASDTAANAWLEGSADGGGTWFALTPYNSEAPSASPTGTGVRYYASQPVTAVKAFAMCSSGNTVTVTVTGE